MDAVKGMKPTYSIFVLDDDEYLGLHKYIPEVKKEDLEISVGFANPKSREAYIRRTNCKALDDETILHEAEELLAKHSSHADEENIRWKKGRDIIAPIATAIGSIINPVLGMAMAGGYGAYKQAKGEQGLGQTLLSTGLAGLGGLASQAARGGQTAMQAAKAGWQAGGGILGKPLSAIQSAITGTSGAQMAAQRAATGLGGQFAAKQAAEFGGTPVTFGGQTSLLTGGARGLSAMPTILGNVMPSIGQVTPGAVQPSPTGIGTMQQVTQPAPTTPPTFMGKIGEIAKQPSTILGGASILGGMATPTPKFEMPPYVSELREKLMAGGSLTPLGEQAKTELETILKSKPTELYPTATDEYYNAALRRTRESYTEAERQLDQAFNLAGMYGSGEHMAEKAKLKEQLARTESGLAAETEQRRFELARTAKYQAIQDSLGVDRDTMDDIAGLTSLSVAQAAMMYGADVQDIQAIREALGTLGIELIMRGIPQAGMEGTTQG